MEKPTHVALVSSPGFTHLVPITEFSKRLVKHRPNFHVTCTIPSLGPPSESPKAYLKTLPSNIHPISLPPINKEQLPQGVQPATLIKLTITHSLPSIHEVLKSRFSKDPLTALVVDVFACQALEFAKEFNALSYVYFPTSALVLSLIFHAPKLDEEVSSEYSNLTEPIKLPGCVPVMGVDLPDPVQSRSSEVYKQFLQTSKAMVAADGIIINTFLELEPSAVRALGEFGDGKIKLYPVGPITQKGSSNEVDESDKCLRWLDKQPPCSVLYVSFGSGGTLSQQQINELACGLELSCQRFLWVLRAPSNLANSAYLEAAKDDPFQFLPGGFLERTKEKGLVVPLWAPQVHVLSHNSVGGFLTHCGWNSTLESVQEGVPLITWPLFAEQKMNAVLLNDGLKVALRPKLNDEGIVEREEIAKMVKCLMEGEEGKGMYERMRNLKDSASNALKDGSSAQTLLQLASHWENLSGI
ncbi:UDP-glycosyltransferase 72B1 [Cajanus cajan]|uniref:Glycosyltransferase n=1 Tax=Cajanus cajan TaxID=3821 RepID=A0A151QNW4_CAJCA|nr:UDP-glycosyltransferase 72B1 [Cajanus cajan]KYP31998.1 Hydroquinone glucosyltransferase [Cajanus cajan]